MSNIQILRNAFKRDNELCILQKKEFDIFYSCKFKYPLLTVEEVNKNTGKTEGSRIERKNVDDPFKADMALPKDCRLYIKNYSDYMQYGGSFGHNAPAGSHKTNISVYNTTFLLSNMCPQEIVLNTGLWNILETWTRTLKNDHRLKDIRVYTGSIPDVKNTQFDKTIINVPLYMFKVVSCRIINEGNINVSEPTLFLTACFLIPNEPPKTKIHKLYKYLIPFQKMCNISQINFNELFTYYSKFNPGLEKMDEMNNHVRTDIHLAHHPVLIRQMHSSEWYGRIVYSKTLEDLENNWEMAKRKNFGDEFHECYYDFAKKRIQRETENPSNANKLVDKYADYFTQTMREFNKSVAQYKSQKMVKNFNKYDKHRHNTKKNYS
jgi:endonuclease G